jgi:hypothetical protein
MYPAAADKILVEGVLMAMSTIRQGHKVETPPSVIRGAGHGHNDDDRLTMRP